MTIGVILSNNSLTTSVSATVNDATLEALQGVTLNASATTDVDSLLVNVGLNASVAETGSLNLAGSGSNATNQSNMTVTAAVVGGGSITTTGSNSPVTIQASGAPSITANAGAGELSAGTGSFAGSITVGSLLATNNIADITQAYVDASSITARGTVTVAAESTAVINSLLTNVDVDLGISGTASLSLGGSGSSANNHVQNQILAFLRNQASITTLQAGAVLVSATDGATIYGHVGQGSLSVGAGGFSGALTVQVALVNNSISDLVAAYASGATVDSVGNISITAASVSDINATLVDVTAQVAVGEGGSLTFSGSGAKSTNLVSSTVTAYLAANADMSGVQVQVLASDQTTVSGSSGNGQIGASGGTFAGSLNVVASIVENNVADEVLAYIDAATIQASGNVSVNASFTGTVSGTAAGATISAAFSSTAGISGGGAGSTVTNSLANQIRAYVTTEATISTTNGADLLIAATDQSTVTASSGIGNLAISGGEFAGSLGVGVVLATNEVTNTVEAYISDATVTVHGDVTVAASSTANATATTVFVTVGVSVSPTAAISAQGDGANSTNQFSKTVQAYLADGATVTTTGTGQVEVTSTDTSNQTATAGGGGAGIDFASSAAANVAVGVVETNNQVTNTVAAYIDNATVQATGDVTVQASGTSDLEATGVSVAVSLSGTASGLAMNMTVNAATASNTIDNTISAYADDASITSSGNVLIEAIQQSTINVTLTAANLGVSATDPLSGVAISLTGAGVGITNNTSSNVAAYVTGSSDITATQNATVNAVDTTTIPTSKAIAVSVSISEIGGSVSAATNTSTIGDTIQSYVTGSNVTSNLGDVTVGVNSTTNLVPTTVPVTATVAILGLSGAGGSTTAAINGTVQSYVGVAPGATAAGPMAQVRAPQGDVTINTTTSTNVTAQTSGASVGTGIAVAAMLATATIGRETLSAVTDQATLEGVNLSVENKSNSNDATAEILVVGVAALAGGAGGNATANVNGSIEAYTTSGSSLIATGDISVKTTVASMEATADARGGSGALGIAVSALTANSNVAGSIASTLAGMASLGLGTLLVGTTGSSGQSTASVDPVSVSFTGGGAGGNATAQYTGSLQAYLDVTAQVQSQGAVEVTAATTAAATATARGGAVAGGAAISALLANATISGSTLSYVAAGANVEAASLTVEATGSLTVSAQMLTVAAALLLGGSGGQANATVSGNVIALVGAADGTPGVPLATLIDTSGAVSITANSTVTSQATADGGSGGAISAGGMVAMATITGSTQAYAGAGTTIEAASLSVNANSNSSQATATTTIGSVSVLGGVGANASATANGMVAAYGASGVSITTSGNTAFQATSTNTTATATSNGGAGGAVTIAAMLASAAIGGTTTANLGTNASVQAGSLQVTANATSTATANTLVVGIGGITGAGGNASATVSPQTSAYLAAGSITNVATGAVTISATATSTATANSSGGSGGVVGNVSVMLATATASGVTQAYVDQGAQLSANSLNVSATANPTANSSSHLTAISTFTGTGVTNSATLDDTTVARLGATNGSSTSHATNLSLGTGGVQLLSTWDGDATTSITVGSGGLLANAGGTTATTTIGSTVAAYAGENTQLVALGDVAISAIGQADATATSFGVTASGGVAAYGTNTTSTMTPTIQAYVDSAANLQLDDLTLQASLNVDSQGNAMTANQVQATGTAGSGALVAAGTGANVTATHSPTVQTWLGDGATVNATENILFAAIAYQAVNSEAKSNNAALGAAVGVTLANAVAQGSIGSVIEGSIVGAQGVTVQAYSNVSVNAEGQANSGGVLAAGDGTSVQATVGTGNSSQPMVVTEVAGTGSIAATGNVSLDALLNSVVTAESSGVTVSAGASVGAMPATISLQPGIVSQIASNGLVTSTTGNVSVLAGHNVNPSNRSLLANTATVTTSNFSASLAINVDSTTVTSTAAPYVEALLDTNARISAPQGTVTLGAVSASMPQAFVSNGGGALISFSSGSAYANVQGTTLATMNGLVRGTNPDAPGALNVNLISRAAEDALAQIKQSSGGGINLSNTYASSTLNPVVTSTLAGTIIASGNVTMNATSNSESDAYIQNVSGGAIDITNYSASSHVTPTTSATIAEDAMVQAGGALNVVVNQGKALPQYSDGTFNPAQSANQLNLTNDSITFTQPHGLLTGNTITYDTLDHLPAIGGLTDGQAYGVLVLSDVALQLGNTFVGQSSSGGNTMGVNLLDETIVFAEPHQLVGNGQSGSSDQVIYTLPTGSSAIGGLTVNQPYLVNVVDPVTIRLVDPSVPLVAPKSFSGSAIQSDNQTIQINNHGFTLAQSVSYEALEPVIFGINQVNLDVTYDSSNQPTAVTPDPTAYNVVMGSSTISEQRFTNGAIVIYQTDGTPISPLVNGGRYAVIYNANQPDQIQLAATSASTTPLSLSTTGVSTNTTHSLLNVVNQPIGGLNSGQTYYVTNPTTNTFQLAMTASDATNGINLIILNPDDPGAPGTVLTGNKNLIGTMGVDFTSVGSGRQNLVIDLTSYSNGGIQQLEGVGQAHRLQHVKQHRHAI